MDPDRLCDTLGKEHHENRAGVKTEIPKSGAGNLRNTPNNNWNCFCVGALRIISRNLFDSKGGLRKI